MAHLEQHPDTVLIDTVPEELKDKMYPHTLHPWTDPPLDADADANIGGTGSSLHPKSPSGPIEPLLSIREESGPVPPGARTTVEAGAVAVAEAVAVAGAGTGTGSEAEAEARAGFGDGVGVEERVNHVDEFTESHQVADDDEVTEGPGEEFVDDDGVDTDEDQEEDDSMIAVHRIEGGDSDNQIRRAMGGMTTQNLHIHMTNL